MRKVCLIAAAVAAATIMAAGCSSEIHGFQAGLHTAGPASWGDGIVAKVTSITGTGGSLVVTFQVTNRGYKPADPSCVVYLRDSEGVPVGLSASGRGQDPGTGTLAIGETRSGVLTVADQFPGSRPSVARSTVLC